MINEAPPKYYSFEEIKKAVFVELEEAGHLGKKNQNYYYICGVLSAALNKMESK